MKNIILYGGPAAGKGTQCELLTEKYGYVPISTGKLFRELDDSTEFNREIHEKISKGILIDDQTTSQLVKNKLAELGNTLVVLDGFPRNINQAHLLDDFFENYIVINIDVDENTALGRALGRVTCDKCGKIYNKYLEAEKPLKDNFCDKCNIELTSRTDDNEESFKTRFSIYQNNVKDILEYYKNKNVLYTVKSQELKEDTFDFIDDILKEQN